MIPSLWQENRVALSRNMKTLPAQITSTSPHPAHFQLLVLLIQKYKPPAELVIKLYNHGPLASLLSLSLPFSSFKVVIPMPPLKHFFFTKFYIWIKCAVMFSWKMPSFECPLAYKQNGLGPQCPFASGLSSSPVNISKCSYCDCTVHSWRQR